MTAVFAKSGNMVCCGGMDNMLTIYDINNRDSNGVAKMVREISGYEVIIFLSRVYSSTDLIPHSLDIGKYMKYKCITAISCYPHTCRCGPNRRCDERVRDVVWEGAD